MQASRLKINRIKPKPHPYLPKNLLCFSHLRWNFVFQRPQQLLSRLAKHFNTYFVEEPIFDSQNRAYLSLENIQKNLSVIVPHLPAGLSCEEQSDLQKELLDRLLASQNMAEFIFWYYTPMALPFSEHLHPQLIIYDCMDELSAFKFAPENISILEKKLFKKADLVFTGGASLFDSKKQFHSNIYPFPSSIDKKHFGKARQIRSEYNSSKKQVKLGFFGVIDERFDSQLIVDLAIKHPEWLIELIGPVVKINADELPRAPNISYIGQIDYQQLPSCISKWDIALIPFHINESTRYISPTKTPEYLAAAKPVISTPIRDVVHPYGSMSLVKIGKNAEDFAQHAEELLKLSFVQNKAWLKSVDEFLAKQSWEQTSAVMIEKIRETLEEKRMISVA